APAAPPRLSSSPTRRSPDLAEEVALEPVNPVPFHEAVSRLGSLLKAGVHDGQILAWWWSGQPAVWSRKDAICAACHARARQGRRSEEHTSELQSLTNLVCRL